MKRKAGQEQIYQVSSSLFQKKGYDAVTMDDICAGVGISKPTLYAQKLTKRDLLVHMYIPEQPHDFFDHSVCHVDNLMDEIYKAVDLIADRIFSFGPDLLRVLLRVHMQTPAFGEIMDEPWKEQMCALIHAAQIRHQIRTDQTPQRLAAIISVYLIGYSFQYAMNQAEESRENLHQSVAALLSTESVHEC